MWTWVVEHLVSWWGALVAFGLVGVIGMLKPGSLIKAFIDFRRGQARIRVEVEAVTGFREKQLEAQTACREFEGNSLLESHRFKIRNISSLPAYVEDVGVECADGTRFVAWRRTGQFLEMIRDGSPVKIEANTFERFVVRVPINETLGPVTHWFVAFNNKQWRVRSKGIRERLPSWCPFSRG